MFESANIDSSVPVYEQIENEVQFAIASGKLKEGDQLPTVRQAAKDLKVNVNTVAKAYRDLHVRRIVTGRRGEGYFVNAGIAEKVRSDCAVKMIDRLHEVVSEAKAAGLAKGLLKEVVSKSFAAKGGPYGETPKSILALAKKKRKS